MATNEKSPKRVASEPAKGPKDLKSGPVQRRNAGAVSTLAPGRRSPARQSSGRGR